MSKLNFIWREQQGQYGSGANLYLNKVKIAGYSYNMLRAQGDSDPNDWIGYVDLPALSRKRILAKTIGEVKGQIEDSIITWFNEVLRG